MKSKKMKRLTLLLSLALTAKAFPDCYGRSDWYECEQRERQMKQLQDQVRQQGEYIQEQVREQRQQQINRDGYPQFGTFQNRWK